MDLRDKAGSFEVKGGTGKVIRTLVIDGYLEVYKIDKTFRVQTPDGLDPERKNPNMPWVISEYSEYGCSHPVIARLLLQSIDILKGACFSSELDQEKIKSTLYDAKDLILNCESIMLLLGQDLENIEGLVEENGVGVKENQRSINPFPQVRNLDDLCYQYLVSAKRCLQNYAVLIDHFYKTGFRSPHFHKIKRWALENLGKDSYLYQIIEKNESRLFRIIDLRNFQEHPNDDKRTEVVNYKLLPEMEIQRPQWFVTGDEPSFILDEMTEITSFLFQIGEVIFLHAVLENLNKKYPYIICAIEENEIDEDCPIAYELSIDVTKISEINKRD